MIADLDIGCWQAHLSRPVPALSRCAAPARNDGQSGLEIRRKGDVFLVQYITGKGNNNGNGNIGNNNGNYNTGNNNGNFNASNGNGNCFADDNNENHNEIADSWDYERMLQELRRCNIPHRQVP
ncbi:hypothetical protein [Labrys neptuniae]